MLAKKRLQFYLYYWLFYWLSFMCFK